MSLNLSRDQFGRPILKAVTTVNNQALLNQLADTKPAGRETVTYQTLTIGNVPVDSTLVNKLSPTTDVTPGTAQSGKALVTDSSRNVSGINKIYVDSLYINGVLLNPNIFKGGAVAVSTNDSSRSELTNITPGVATGNKALVLDNNGKISNIKKIQTEAYETGRTIVVNRNKNSIKMNNIDYFNRLNNKNYNTYIERFFTQCLDIGINDTINADFYILENCYSSPLGLHVAAFSNNTLAYSYNGYFWIPSVSYSAVTYVNWFGDIGLFIGVGGNNIFYSSDGINWTSKKIANISLYCVEWSKELNLFVVGGQNRILYSNDLQGTTTESWTYSDYVYNSVRQIIYIESSKMFIGRTDTNFTSLIYSTNGKQWIAQPVMTGNFTNIKTLCYCKSKNLILAMAGPGSGGRAFRIGFYSKDGGLTFKPIYSSNTSYSVIWKVKYIPGYDIFIGSLDHFSRSAELAYSVNGIDWKGVAINTDGIEGAPLKSITYDPATSMIYMRSQKNFFGRQPQYKFNLNSLYSSAKTYFTSSNTNILSLNSSDDKLLNIGNKDGNIISFLNTVGDDRNVTINNGELKIKSINININVSLLYLYDSNPVFTNNLLYINNQTESSYYTLSKYDTDVRKKNNYILSIDSNNSISISGYLKVNELNVAGGLFDTSDNIAELTGNKIGVAGANKFLLTKYGGEVSGVNTISTNNAVVGDYIISSSRDGEVKTVSLGGRAGKSGINTRHSEYICNPFGSTLYNNSGIYMSSYLWYFSNSASDKFYYIKEMGLPVTFLPGSNGFAFPNMETWPPTVAGNSIYPTGITGLNALVKLEYIKELNSYYAITNTGLYTSKDIVSWKSCNTAEDINSNAIDFAYSPQMNTMLLITTNRNQISKNGIDFRITPDFRYDSRLNCVVWVASWGLFVGATNYGNNGSFKQFVYSKDGMIWDFYENQEETLIKSYTVPFKLIYSPKLDMLITSVGSIIRYTYDGKVWNSYRMPPHISNFNGRIVWVDELEIFVGSSSAASNALLYYSYDGLTWLVLKTPSTINTTTYPNFSGDWVFMGKIGALVNLSTSTTAGMITISNKFLKTLPLNSMGMINEPNDNISIDIRNNRVGLGVASPQFSLHLGEDLAFKPTTSTWATSSDERLKEDIEDADVNMCYENVKNIPLKKFKWKEDVYKNKVQSLDHVGWIAQDVEQIIPKAVERKNMHGYSDCRTLNNDQIIANMYGAIKKLMRIDNELDDYFE